MFSLQVRPIVLYVSCFNLKRPAGTALDVRYGKTSVDCMSVSGKQSYHSLDYFLYGYNIMKGYPNQNGLDPGFTFPLFRAEYNNSTMSADCR